MQAASQLIELLYTQTLTRTNTDDASESVIEPSAPNTPRWSQNPLQSPFHTPICGPGDELDDDEAYFLGEDEDDDDDDYDDDDDDLDDDLDDDDDDLDDDVNLDEEDF